ncbi:flagellar hook-basal body complex protein FliE [Buchnera aphidicola]|uniref:flagellar hook-basal body complex protein FliE n=1 Tax=Buchnera aphidicola TaxID=9 RepID=UPI0034639F88
MFIDTINNCEKIYNKKIKNLKVKETTNFKKFIILTPKKNKRINVNNENKTNFLKNQQENLSFEDSIIKLEKSELSVQTAMKIVNKLISVYQEVMNLQL